jgi:hypothetical protein
MSAGSAGLYGKGMTALAQQTTLQSLAIICDDVIETIPSASFERLLELLQGGQSFERFGFRIRAAVALEIISRLERKGLKRAEINKALSAVAKDAEIELSTLREDISILRQWPDLRRVDPIVEREYYLRALSAPDPQSALDYAVQQKAEGKGFSTRDMREYVGRLNNGTAPEAIEAEHWAKVLFTNEGWQALQELCKRRDKSINDCINDVVIEADEWHKGKR